MFFKSPYFLYQLWLKIIIEDMGFTLDDFVSFLVEKNVFSDYEFLDIYSLQEDLVESIYL